MSDPKKFRAVPTGTDDNTFRIQEGILAIKDWSLEPKDNTDRLAKLGNMRAQIVGVVCKFDEATMETLPNDGLHVPGPHGLWFFEPDNFVHRVHKFDGEEGDRVYAIRAIADHSNVHNERENRSTPIIDQRSNQNQGTFHEVFWVKDVLAVSTQLETIHDAAGEWIGLCSNDVPTGNAKKYHTTWNFHKLAGYVTDSGKIAQLKHLFKIIEFDRDVPSGGVEDKDCNPITPDPGTESVGGRISNDDGDLFGELGLWSDIMFYQDSGHKGPLGIDSTPDGCPKGDIKWGGLLWSNRDPQVRSDQIMTDATNPDTTKPESAIEDSLEFGRKKRLQWVRPWIKIVPPDVPTVPQMPTVPPGDGGGPNGGGRTPVVTQTGGNWVETYSAGVKTGVQMGIPIQSLLEAAQGVILQIVIKTPSSLSGYDTIELASDYRIAADSGPYAAWSTSTLTLVAGDFVGIYTHRLELYIPASAFTGKQNGMLQISFNRLGNADTYALDLYVESYAVRVANVTDVGATWRVEGTVL